MDEKLKHKFLKSIQERLDEIFYDEALIDRSFVCSQSFTDMLTLSGNLKGFWFSVLGTDRSICLQINVFETTLIVNISESYVTPVPKFKVLNLVIHPVQTHSVGTLDQDIIIRDFVSKYNALINLERLYEEI